MSKCYRDYNPRDIRSIDIDQSFLQRLVGVGDLTISTAATAEGAEQIKSIPDPKGVRDLILAQRGSGGRARQFGFISRNSFNHAAVRGVANTG